MRPRHHAAIMSKWRCRSNRRRRCAVGGVCGGGQKTAKSASGDAIVVGVDARRLHVVTCGRAADGQRAAARRHRIIVIGARHDEYRHRRLPLFSLREGLKVVIFEDNLCEMLAMLLKTYIDWRGFKRANSWRGGSRKPKRHAKRVSTKLNQYHHRLSASYKSARRA